MELLQRTVLHAEGPQSGAINLWREISQEKPTRGVGVAWRKEEKESVKPGYHLIAREWS